jgi:phage terminase large subunit-like protein
MSTFMLPAPDAEPWPTLGLDVCEFIESHLCHGPGDLLGEAVELDDEQRGWICKMYEIHPETLQRRKRRVVVNERNPEAGKRRFQRCALSLRKGSNKTEFAAWIAAVELHHEGPVRCAGFTTRRGVRVPVGRAVTDPYIPMISYTEEQTEELAYGALRRILEKCSVGSDFDIGLERIMRRSGDGKAEAVSASPNARDGARTTHEHADETHRFTLDSLKRAWSVMLANLAKRPLADPWALETTTAPEPGALSVAENTMEYARQIAEKGTGDRAHLFFFHRQASDTHNLETEEGLRAAVVEASGPYISKWSAIDRIAASFREPDADLAYLERVWLNRPVQASGIAFDIARWRELARPWVPVPSGSAITLGFDGSRYDDATALVATAVSSGFQWPLGIWAHSGLPNWEVPVAEVDGAVSDAFERYAVVRMYCDPPKWESWVSTWAGRYGDSRVVEWWTNRRKPMAYALRSFITAMAAGEITHNGDPVLASHIANARRLYTNLVDEQGVRLWILRKERPDSPNKIDAAMAANLSWEARNDAVAAGEGDVPEPSLHFLSFSGGR